MKKRNIMIAPSILACDFGRLAEEVKKAEEAGADMLHIDVMDGHFVPNITIGPCVVSSIKRHVKIPLDVHLMISDPLKYAERFADAGSDILTFHAEACENPFEIISKIRSLKNRVGVSVKPNTPIDTVRDLLDKIDMMLVMTVEPGFGGQSFIRNTLKKITALREVFDKDIQVDGGITAETAKEAIGAGANILVAGTAVFGKKDYKSAINALRG
jgi:ribulose-phosphate 3-epimerase